MEEARSQHRLDSPHLCRHTNSKTPAPPSSHHTADVTPPAAHSQDPPHHTSRLTKPPSGVSHVTESPSGVSCTSCRPAGAYAHAPPTPAPLQHGLATAPALLSGGHQSACDHGHRVAAGSWARP
ncbi:MAG: hypothetical protein WDW36_007100 [Sanguina aurantia]